MIFRAIFAFMAVTLSATIVLADTTTVSVKLHSASPREMLYDLGLLRQDVDKDIYECVVSRWRKLSKEPEAPREDDDYSSRLLLPPGINAIAPFTLDNALDIYGEVNAVDELKKIVQALDDSPEKINVFDDTFELTKVEAEMLGLDASADDGPKITEIAVGRVTTIMLHEMEDRRPKMPIDRPFAVTMSLRPTSLSVYQGEGTVYSDVIAIVNGDGTLTVHVDAQVFTDGRHDWKLSQTISFKRDINNKDSIFLGVTGVQPGKATLIELRFEALNLRRNPATSLPVKLDNVTPTQMLYALGVRNQSFDEDIDAYVAGECGTTYTRKDVPWTSRKLPQGITWAIPIRLENALLVRGESQAVEELRKSIVALDVTPRQVMIKDESFQLTDAEAQALGLAVATADGPTIRALPVGLVSLKMLYEIRRGQPWKTIDRPIATALSGDPVTVLGRWTDYTPRVFVLPFVNADGSLTVYLRAQARARGKMCAMIALKRDISDNGSVFLGVTGVERGKATLIGLTFTTIGTRSESSSNASKEQGGSAVMPFTFPNFR